MLCLKGRVHFIFSGLLIYIDYVKSGEVFASEVFVAVVNIGMDQKALNLIGRMRL